MWPIINMLEKDRATDTGNMHKNVVKIAHVLPEISCHTDRQTYRQTYLSQYFATAPVGEVKIKIIWHSSSAIAERPRDTRVTLIRKTAKWNF